MYSLPTSVNIKGKDYAVRNRGDFRTVLDCFQTLDTIELTKEERILTSLILFYEDLHTFDDLSVFDDLLEAYNQMVWFFNCGQEEIGKRVNYKLIDWEKDSSLIFSAVNNVAQKEVRSEDYLHWWTFMGYYLAIGECSLSNIVAIREKRAKGKKLEKYERQFINENPQYFWSNQTIEQQEMDAEIRRMWENGGE